MDPKTTTSIIVATNGLATPVPANCYMEVTCHENQTAVINGVTYGATTGAKFWIYAGIGYSFSGAFSYTFFKNGA